MPYVLPIEMIAAFQAAAQDIHAGIFRERGEAARGVNPFAVVSIWQADDIPVDAMPGWLAHALFSLAQLLERDHWAYFYESLAWAGARWSTLDDTRWGHARREFAARALEYLLAIVAPLQPDPPPRYWREIAPSSQAVIRALRGDGDLARAAHALQCWSIPEGNDLWDEENATYEAMTSAKYLADAAFGQGDDDAFVMGQLMDEVVFGGRQVGTACFLWRTLMQGLIGEISAAQFS